MGQFVLWHGTVCSLAWNSLFFSMEQFVHLHGTVCSLAWNSLFIGMEQFVHWHGTVDKRLDQWGQGAATLC